MTFGNLKELARAYALDAKQARVSDNILELILNNGAKDVARRSRCLPADETFNAVADQADYDMRNVSSRYLCMDKSGLWYRSSTTSNYQQLYARTEKWMNENKPGWRDFASGTPEDYIVKKSTITVIPAPDTAESSAFWSYFCLAPQAMTDDDHYPFGYNEEYSHLEVLHESILFFWLWKARLIGNKGVDDYRVAESTYEREIGKAIGLLERRADIQNDYYTKFMGKKIR